MTLLLLLACQGTPMSRQSPAEDLGIFDPELPDDLSQQATAALASDARRREARFQDAVDPGYLFRSTRIEQAEIAGKLWSPAEIFDVGGRLFNLTFTAAQGLGGADSRVLRRFELGARGGPDATACANCHWRGGPAGGGDGADNAYLDGDGQRQSSALARNPPPLQGLGLIELLAAEMSSDLGHQRDDLVAAAKREGHPLKADLSSKGVSFGWLGAMADGSLDTRGLQGVDADLVVKPFGWKGTATHLRDVVEDEALLHLGVESGWLADHGELGRVGDQPRPDPDGDGVIDELSEGQVTALTLYVAMQETPISQMPTRQDWLSRWAVGEGRFRDIGCAACHVPELSLDSAVFSLPARDGGADVSLDLGLDGAQPRALADASGHYPLRAFTDLKRHHMGDELAEGRPYRGVDGDLFLTPPLWGLTRSRPYLHDGRAPDVETAILAHGGEALEARNAYQTLDKAAKYELRLYLSALNRAPRLVAP